MSDDLLNGDRVIGPVKYILQYENEGNITKTKFTVPVSL